MRGFFALAGLGALGALISLGAVWLLTTLSPHIGGFLR
jgi:hypothetical protein